MEGLVALASVGRRCHSIPLLPGWVGKGSAGARMSLAGGATEADSGNRELGEVQYADSEAAADPRQTWVPRRGPRSTGTLDRKTQTVSRPRYGVSPELRVVEMWEQNRRQEEGAGSGRGLVETRG